MSRYFKLFLKNIMPTNRVGYGRAEGVLICGLISPKQKRHTIIYAALNSVLECVTAVINNKLYMQGRKDLTFSIPALGTKVSTFLIKVLTGVSKFYINTLKSCANAIRRYKTQIMLVVKSKVTSETFFKVGERQKQILLIYKHLKYVKQKNKKNHTFWFFFGT